MMKDIVQHFKRNKAADLKQANKHPGRLTKRC